MNIILSRDDEGEHSPVELIHPTLTSEPDGWYTFAAEADPADVKRWSEAIENYAQAQQEMRTAWQVKRDAAVAEEERERAASMAELRAEQEAARLEQERLDVEIGPREWVWTTRKLARREYMKVAHKIGCSSAQTREGYGPGARLGDMVNTLLKAGLNERIDAYNRGLTICGRCGGPLALAYREADAERKAATYREALEKQG